MGIDAGYGIGSVKPGVCTSTTRPASPYTGQIIYETDTTLAKVWTGSAWVDTPPGKANTSNPTFTNMPIFSAGAISSTAGSTVTAHRDHATFTNGEILDTKLLKVTSGGDWQNNAWIIQKQVDVTPQSYIKFGPASVALGGSSSTDGLIVDSSGRVTKPNQPYVHAYNTVAGSWTTGYNGIPFNGIYSNVGSHWNTSNNTFTAPVAGNYLVQVQIQLRSEANNNDWAFNLGIYKNQVIQTGTYQAGIAGKTYMKHSVVGVIKMAANDYIDIKVLVNQSTVLEGAGDPRNTLFISLLG